MESELASSLRQYDKMVLWSRPWAVGSDCVQISVLLEAYLFLGNLPKLFKASLSLVPK